MPNYLAILPEIGLLVLAVILMIVDLRIKPENKNILPWLTFIGLAVIFAELILFARPTGEGELIWGGMLHHDLLAFTFRGVFIFSAAATTLFTMKWDKLWNRGEFYILLSLSTLGMSLMAFSADLVMLFVAIETASIPLYVLAGFMKSDDKSNEAGIKYLLYGALTSSIMAYGFSLFYGFAGTTNLYEMAALISAGDVQLIALVGAVMLALAGFGFKIAAVPFHFWAPDVYEGAPTPVTAFLSTASKSAGFAVVLRFLLIAMPQASAPETWVPVVAVLSAASMTIGNVIALSQTNIKRLLAYSSIAHAGYMLMGVAAASDLGMLGVIYYAVVYMLTTLAAFGIVIIVSHTIGSDEIKDYAGLSRRHPGLAFGMLLMFLSLAGIPPLGGFIGKFLLFGSVVESGIIWLAIVGAVNTIIGLYYYLIVLKVVYLDRNEATENEPLPVYLPHGVTVAVCAALVLVLGIIFTPLYGWGSTVAAAFFG